MNWTGEEENSSKRSFVLVLVLFGLFDSLFFETLLSLVPSLKVTVAVVVG